MCFQSPNFNKNYETILFHNKNYEAKQINFIDHIEFKFISVIYIFCKVDTELLRKIIEVQLSN